MIQTLSRKINFSEFVGMNTQLEWFSKDIREKQIQYLKDCGVMNIRMGLHWDIHEPVKGLYDLAVIDPVMDEIRWAGFNCICYVVGWPKWIKESNDHSLSYEYCDFIKVIKAKWPWLTIQIWNEPNLPSYWSGIVDYAMFFADCRFLTRLLSKEVLPAGFAYAELGNFFPINTPAFLHDYSLDLRDSKETVNNHPGVKFVLGETGDSTYTGPVEEQELIDEDEQSSRLIKRIFTAMTMNIKSMYIFTLSDLDARASNRDRCYGLLKEDGQLKVSGSSFFSICKLFQGKTLSPVKLSEKIKKNLSGVEGVCFKCDGLRHFVLWGDDEVWIDNSFFRVRQEPVLFTA